MTARTVADALDIDALEAWLRAADVDVLGPLRAELIPGGRSNLTFFLTDAAGHRWVLRRPPLGTLLATAHDVGREFRVLSALGSSAVPTPRVIGMSSDVAGVPFYVMHEVPGLVVRTGAEAAALPEPARARAGEALVDGLVALHAVDAHAAGLATLGRGDGYLERQVRAWQRQAEQYRVGKFAEADWVADRLLAVLPAQQETTLVHGDFRLDNALVNTRGELQAVLDWELCTRGDPRVDLAVFLYYWAEPGDPTMPFPDPPTVLPGFGDRASLLARYEQQSGRTLDRDSFFLAYGAWRLAMVFEGIVGRSAAGSYGDRDLAEERRLTSAARDLVSHADALLAEEGS